MTRLYIQHGALPFKWDESGALKIMLLMTRGRKRWMIPKGWPSRGLAPHETAAREAYEEAGLIGQVDPKPIGSFTYAKRLRFSRKITCIVEVFPLLVDYQRHSWLEQEERETQWFSTKRSASLVDEPTLRTILLLFDRAQDFFAHGRHGKPEQGSSV